MLLYVQRSLVIHQKAYNKFGLDSKLANSLGLIFWMYRISVTSSM